MNRFLLIAALLLTLTGGLAACGQIKPATSNDSEHAGGGY